MTDAFRRSLVLLIVIAISVGIFAAVSHIRDPERKGILSFLNPTPPSAKTGTPGTKSEPESFTLAPAAETLPGLTALSQEYANLMDRVRPAVVSINTKTKLDTLHRINLYQAVPATIDKPGLGSGVIVSKEGHVLTNFHVIDGVDEIQITTNSGRTYECTLIGYRANNDLAVLKITTEEDRDFPAVAFGDSDKVRVGEIVFAIGNPFGLGETVTQGIISALPRPLSDSDFKTFQTDTVINPGNSGGPLIGTNGDIVGISTAIFTNSADQSYAGVSLAVPSNDALEAFTRIMEKGKPAKGYLGVRARDLESYDRVRFGAPRDRGVLIAEVTEGSPADKAGLKPGDVVVSFNGRAVRSVEDFITRIGRTTVEKPLPVEVIAGGIESSLEATLVSWEEFFEPAEESGEAVAKISDALGITVQNLSMMHRRRLGLSGSSPGILLTSVDTRATLAAKLTAGDILYQLNDKPIRTAAQFDTLIDGLTPGREARLFYSRYIGNRLVSGVVRFTPNPK